MLTGRPSGKPIPLCWKWNQPDQTCMEWQHSKIRSMKLNMQDLLVRSPAAHISNQIAVRRCCASFPSSFSLTPCAAEEDGWTNRCSWKECKWKTPTTMHIIPDEKVAVVVCLGQQVLESPNDIMHEDLLSSGSHRRGIAIKSVRLKRILPRKVVTVLPSIQGNLLSRDATNSSMELLWCHCLRPEGGHTNHRSSSSKVVVLHRLKSCVAIRKEVPNFIRGNGMVAKHNVLAHNKIGLEVHAPRDIPRV